MNFLSSRSFAVLFSLLFCAGAFAAPAARRPNIIAIVTDDQSRWSIGAYGNRDARTPNMDRR